VGKHPARTEFIVELYCKRGFTMAQVAKKVGMSPMGVWRRLKKAGVEDSRVEVECGWCGILFKKGRATWRKSTYHFCCVPCCTEWTRVERGNGFKENKESCKRARKLVKEWFDLKGGQDGNIVHHVDGNEGNNELSNLWVFENHADHHRFHLDGGAEPIWKGSECVGPPRPYMGYEVQGYWQNHWYPTEGVHRRIFVQGHRRVRV
jgi:hypothetical protein